MNDRMKELDKAAQEFADRMRTVGNEEGFNVEWFNTYKKKFSELIVKDCFSCCNAAEKIEWPDLTSTPPTYEVGVMACKVKIQLHFGVRE